MYIFEMFFVSNCVFYIELLVSSILNLFVYFFCMYIVVSNEVSKF